MELKTKYQYTYFIYPYIIKQNEYNKYLKKLLNNPNFAMKIFDKEKDEDLYSYFLPKVRDTMFWTMNYDKNNFMKLDEISKDMRSTLISQYPCTMFEYFLNENIQGKAGKRDGIFFDITNIELVCFEPGICFLLMKTVLEDNHNLSDLCNFNYKFRDIKSSAYEYRGYENIKIQTDRFDNIREITDLIKEITGNSTEATKLNIDTDRFITYSYACVGQEDWSIANSELLEKEFYKFANVEKADYKVDSSEKNSVNKMSIIEKSKNEFYGCSNVGTVLLTSDVSSENYTKRQREFERQYLYQYIFDLYKKISLKKLNYDLQKKNMLNQFKEEFEKFIQAAGIEEITNDNIGSQLETEWTRVLKINIIYSQLKGKYDMLYKNSNIEKTANTNKIIVVILILLVVMNLISIIKIF